MSVDILWLVIALPLTGATILLVAGRRIGEPVAGWLASAFAVAAFLIAVPLTVQFFTGSGEVERVFLFHWIPVVDADASLLWDPLSALMTLIVTGIGSVITIYAIGYMHGDERFGRFFAYMNLFLGSMLILVLADNYAFLFVGWELVGLCSYLLISFWFVRPSASAAGKKAFVVNRIGDAFFLVALMILFVTFGTFDFTIIFESAPVELSTSLATAITLLLFLGAAGKSAQLPLYVWLPDAMEGPTPVSALIHAATMVTAGVYLLARSAVLLELAPFTGGVVATVGVLTAAWAAIIALGQRDIKRVLAYSTISQLGYMVLAVGIGAYVAGMFHLTTHAFFKALLFLGAGSVIHAMSDEQDMWKMGGLRKHLPITFWTMVVAWLAIVGVFPLSGFWSKDEILASAFGEGFYVLWAIGILTALLTSFYMSRLMFLTFLGKRRWDDGIQPHESPAVMTAALVVLAVPAAVIGGFNTPFRLGMEHFLEPSFEAVEAIHPPGDSTLVVLAGASLVLVAVGIAYAYLRYLRRDPAPEVGGVWSAWDNGFYVDALYGRLIVLPGKAVARWTWRFIDEQVIDGAVNGTGRLVRGLGGSMRPLQSGWVRTYAAGVAAGTLGLVLWFLIAGGGFG